MSLADFIVLGGSIAFLALFFWWFFFAKGEEATASVGATGVQEVRIEVKGGYKPDHITVEAGKPVRLLFDRQEENPCSDRVVIPEVKVNRELPAFATTAVEFTPQAPGELPFTCGMGMLHGTITVK